MNMGQFDKMGIAHPLPPPPSPYSQHLENLSLKGNLAQLLNKKIGTHHCDMTIQMTRKQIEL